jgi:hypothetical protein
MDDPRLGPRSSKCSQTRDCGSGFAHADLDLDLPLFSAVTCGYSPLMASPPPSAPAAHSVFVYGTLMAEEVVRVLLRAPPEPVHARVHPQLRSFKCFIMCSSCPFFSPRIGLLRLGFLRFSLFFLISMAGASDGHGCGQSPRPPFRGGSAGALSRGRGHSSSSPACSTGAVSHGRRRLGAAVNFVVPVATSAVPLLCSSSSLPAHAQHCSEGVVSIGSLPADAAAQESLCAYLSPCRMYLL